jgi:hypothetical protein
MRHEEAEFDDDIVDRLFGPAATRTAAAGQAFGSLAMPSLPDSACDEFL